MNKFLIDSDVLLDFFFDRKPHAEFSAEILSLCESKKTEGYITSVILNNVYYLLRKTASHKMVIDKLRQLLMIVDVLLIEKKSILHAMDSRFKDFEDALQNYAAVNSQQVNVIITRNTKDYKNSELSIMTPENYLNAIVDK